MLRTVAGRPFSLAEPTAHGDTVAPAELAGGVGQRAKGDNVHVEGASLFAIAAAPGNRELEGAHLETASG